jgi:hypothetical protein
MCLRGQLKPVGTSSHVRSPVVLPLRDIFCKNGQSPQPCDCDIFQEKTTPARPNWRDIFFENGVDLPLKLCDTFSEKWRMASPNGCDIFREN